MIDIIGDKENRKYYCYDCKQYVLNLGHGCMKQLCVCCKSIDCKSSTKIEAQ